MYSSTGRAAMAVTSYLRFNHSRVTVLGLLLTVLGQCVCLSVCLRLFSDYMQATGRLMSDTNSFSATRQ